MFIYIKKRAIFANKLQKQEKTIQNSPLPVQTVTPLGVTKLWHNNPQAQDTMKSVTPTPPTEGFDRCPAAACMAIPGQTKSNNVQTNHPARPKRQSGSISAETLHGFEA